MGHRLIPALLLLAAAVAAAQPPDGRDGATLLAQAPAQPAPAAAPPAAPYSQGVLTQPSFCTNVL